MTPDGTFPDTGPLFAVVDPQNQPEQFQRCITAMLALLMPLVTTWPCLSEAMHLAGRTGSWQMQALIAELIIAGTLKIHTPSDGETLRALELMRVYRDRPMDLADASLIALAETVSDTRIFSIDSDFYVYRLAEGSALEVMPGPMSEGR